MRIAINFVILSLLISLSAVLVWYWKNKYEPPFPCQQEEEIGTCLVRDALERKTEIFTGTVMTILVYGDNESLKSLRARLHTMVHNDYTPMMRTLPFGLRYDGQVYYALIDSLLSGDVQLVISAVKDEAGIWATHKNWTIPLVVNVLLARGQLDDVVKFVKGTQNILFERTDNDQNTIRKKHILSIVCAALLKAGRNEDVQALVNNLPANSYYLDKLQKSDFEYLIFEDGEEGVRYMEEMMGAPWRQQSRDPFLIVHLWDKPKGYFPSVTSMRSIDTWAGDGEKAWLQENLFSQPDTQARAERAADMTRFLVYTRSKNVGLLKQIWPYAINPCWHEKTQGWWPVDWNTRVRMQCLFYLMPQISDD